MLRDQFNICINMYIMSDFDAVTHLHGDTIYHFNYAITTAKILC